ncbi:protein phosphatase 1, regulatory (inhibitor) subunit 14Ab [Erpetoichthys calabaricus]|uniref:Protein phosphatase 1 regulatory subunit 14A n=1 Tax=Erpetoichthys calabaricus TaxID=27687 RepID=A0A8C4REJ3_ERPCA|nr:protein phosphatase 1, regulatory (inhibitor) subunit 14Ab [Erpetoichthys calabaricus]
MAANRVGRRLNNKTHSPSRGNREPGLAVQKRQARVTVKYDRKELQRRLDVEKWIDERLVELYLGREAEMPEEVNIDSLLDLPSDEERARQLQDILHNCNNNTEVFIRELIFKLHGLQKQDVLHNSGIEPHN